MHAATEVKQTAAWTKIVSAILHYQNNHRGLSPTDEMIAIESGISRDVVRSQLREMERHGLLTDSKRWPRHIRVNRELVVEKVMEVIDPKQQPTSGKADITQNMAWRMASPAKRRLWSAKGGRKQWAKKTPEEKAEAVRKMHAARWPKKAVSQVETVVSKEEEMKDMKPHTVKSYDYRNQTGKTITVPARKRMAFFERAKQVAAAIDDYADKNGMPPSAAYLRQKINMGGSSGFSVIAAHMVEEGWLNHRPGHHNDYVLTNLGRQTLLHASSVEKEVMRADPVPDAPERPAQPRTEASAFSRPPEITIRRMVPDAPPAAPQRSMSYADGIPDLREIDSLDLAMELQRRGWRVMR